MRSTYRCSGCRKLFNGPEGKHGDLCQCGSGRLELVARLTPRMLREAEMDREMLETLGG